MEAGEQLHMQQSMGHYNRNFNGRWARNQLIQSLWNDVWEQCNLLFNLDCFFGFMACTWMHYSMLRGIYPIIMGAV